jgi:hypothetical protein
VRVSILGIALALVGSCNTPPTFPVPSGPAKTIGLDVTLPVYVSGTWLVDEFSEALGLELAKYNIRVVDRRSRPGTVALIVLGRLTYREWQEIDVTLAQNSTTTQLGRIRLPDLSMTTIDVAAQLAAPLIARRIWAPVLAAPSSERTPPPQ